MAFSPLRITWRLDTPWVPPAKGLHLDGLIAHALVQRALQDEQSLSDDASFDSLLADLPFERHEGANGWCWKASLLQVSVIGSERRYMTTKTPSQSIAEWTALGVISPKGGAKVDTVRGLYKAGAMHYPLEHVDTIHAWCVGDPDVIADLLSDIPALGLKTRLGHGRLTETDGMRFEMNEDAQAMTNWTLRNMPDEIDGYLPVAGPLRSPYWLRSAEQIVWRPTC
ncbi:type IV CRISPR-associated protein Csf3 [Burkholderia gladioli]|uniref:type IV CRISPR-associated protein Csf3 n=1 Tax=Burkholderia gladioli TaxID=28095 RepID=UPI001641AACD|nr:type IV CRISPR-associated protein Csf3 [Burkholderia gladioli]